MDCEQSIEKKACIEARVKVNSDTDAGEVILDFIGEPKRESCDNMLRPECEFVVSQMVCIKIPIQFSAEAEVVESGIVCENKRKDCEPSPCDDERKHEVFLIRKDDPESKPGRSFARNYLLTYQNNSQST